MMKKILSSLAVMLLAVMLTVGAFAAGYSSLALGVAGEGVDYTQLEEGDEFKVYVVVSPTAQPGTNAASKKAAVYRPYGSEKEGAGVGSGNADVYGQTLTVTWNADLLELKKTTDPAFDGYVITEGATDGTEATYTTKDGATLHKVHMMFGATASVVTPVITNKSGSFSLEYDSTVADNVSVSLGKNGGKLLGFGIHFGSEQSNYVYNGAVVELTFVAKKSGEDVDAAIELSDTYCIGGFEADGGTKYAYTSADQANKKVTVSLKAGCMHPEENRTYVTDKCVDATCYSEGKKVYNCGSCGGTNIEETVGTTDHNYTVRKNLTDPTCTADGVSYNYCSNEGCYEFSEVGAREEGSEETVPMLGHTWKHVQASALSCVTPGKEFYYCERCLLPANVRDFTVTPAADAATVAAHFYNSEDGKFYTDAEFKSETTSLGTWYHVVAALGHDWQKNEDGSYTCLNAADGLCTGENRLVRYVGATDKGNGGTVDTATTFAEAMTYFVEEGLSAEDSVTIYVVEDFSLVRQQYSSRDTRKAFEEKPHDFPITITSLNKNNKSTITFVNGTAEEYHLYGPTTFENIKFTATSANAGTYMCARGFKLVLGEGIEMVNVSGTTDYSKTDAGIDDFGTTVKISDVKMYVVGGVRGGGSYGSFDHKSLHVEMEILSGNYHSIHYFNRTVADPYTDATAFVTIGNITTDSIIPSDSAVNYNNCHVVLMYIGQFNIKTDYLFGYQATSVGTGNRIDRLYFPGAKGSKLGDFGLNKVFKLYADATAYYYDGVNATSMVSNFLIKGFDSKATVGQNSGYINYNITTAPLSEWCALYGNKFFGNEEGHSYDENGVCTFCETERCTTHRKTAWRVASEPTCAEAGLKQQYCTKCYTIVATEEIPTTDEHTYAWVDDNGTYVTKCSVCGQVGTLKDEDGNVIAVPDDLTNIYVSVNGTGVGGFSPKTPLNDFTAAMKFAAAAGADATVHIMDEIVVHYTNNTANYTYAEPKHTNTITIRGYEDTKGVFRLGGDTGVGSGAKVVYYLNGPTVFENMEISGGLSPEKIYFLCQHNPVEFGENVSADVQRTNTGGPTSRVSVYGGCYDQTTCSHATGGADITLRSGVYNDIIGSAVRSGCKLGDVNIKILGNITVNEFFILGASGSESNPTAAGNINFTLDGEVMVNTYFSFGTASSTGKAKNVTLNLISGTIVTECWSGTSRALGTPTAGELTTDRVETLTVNYFPSVSTVRILCDRIAAAADKTKFSAHILTDDNYCYANLGDHDNGGAAAIESLAATCYGEGYDKYVCVDCGEEYTVVSEIIDHTLVSAGTIEANCVSPALNKEVCSLKSCGAAVYTVVEGSAIAPDAHNIVDGVCTYCKRTEVQLCGDHEFGDEIPVDGSCGSGTKRVCDTCGYVEVNIANATHNYGPYSVTVEPTETTAGIKSRTCKSCGKVDTAILSSSDSLHTEAVATDAEGNIADFDIALSKLTKYERAAVNALLQETAYGSEVKVSYSVDADGVTNITYSIPVPAEYNDMTNVKVVVKDDEGKFHVVDFKLDMGYIVFTF